MSVYIFIENVHISRKPNYSRYIYLTFFAGETVNVISPYNGDAFSELRCCLMLWSVAMINFQVWWFSWFQGLEEWL